jgi:hypothetical protein
MIEVLKVLINQLDDALDDFHLAHILIELANTFEAAGCSDPPNTYRRSDDIRALLISRLDLLRDRFQTNFKNDDVFYTDQIAISKKDISTPPEWKMDNSLWWKPTNGLWSSPRISKPSTNLPFSAWIIRAEEFGDASIHKNQIEVKRNGVVSRQLTSLNEALELLRNGESFLDACVREYENGTQVIDFTWNVVFEAELAALHDELDPYEFPCGLGVESTIWLDLAGDYS